MKTLRYFNLAAFALATMFATACGGDDKQEGKLDNGQTCSADSNCKSGKCGDDNKCVEKSDISNDKKENGEICTKDDDCKSGYCDDGLESSKKMRWPNLVPPVQPTVNAKANSAIRIPPFASMKPIKIKNSNRENRVRQTTIAKAIIV